MDRLSGGSGRRSRNIGESLVCERFYQLAPTGGVFVGSCGVQRSSIGRGPLPSAARERSLERIAKDPRMSEGSQLSVAMNGSSNSSLHSCPARAKAADVMPLPAWARAYVYGIQGFVYEVVFTALFDFLFDPSGNPTLRGCSTVASFFIYGLCGLLCEQAVFLYCRRRGYSLVYRLPLYVLTIYTWEFTCGLLLRLVNACSWDYSHYPLNFMGLVTLAYAPLWVLLCLFHDKLYEYIYRLNINNKDITFKAL